MAVPSMGLSVEDQHQVCHRQLEGGHWSQLETLSSDSHALITTANSVF